MPYCGAISCPPLRSVQSSGPEFIKLEMFISCTTVLQLIYQKNDPVHLLLDLTLGVRARAAGYGEIDSVAVLHRNDSRMFPGSWAANTAGQQRTLGNKIRWATKYVAWEMLHSVHSNISSDSM